MVTQYPYNLEVEMTKESTYNEQTGTWSEESKWWKLHSECRDEMSSSGTKVLTIDGEQYEYSWVIFMPKSSKVILPGTKVRVKDGDKVRVEARAIRFSNDQLHSRLWL